MGSGTTDKHFNKSDPEGEELDTVKALTLDCNCWHS